jgi:hypothetical protein
VLAKPCPLPIFFKNFGFMDVVRCGAVDQGSVRGKGAGLGASSCWVDSRGKSSDSSIGIKVVTGGGIIGANCIGGRISGTKTGANGFVFGGWVGRGIGTGSFVLFCNKRLIPVVTVGGGSKVKAVGSWAFIQSDCMVDGPSEHVSNCD